MASVAGEHFDISFDHDEVLQMMDMSEIDGALLTELLDDYSQLEDYSSVQSRPKEADQTSGAGFSQAQLASAGGFLQDSIHPHDEHCEDCGLDDILSDLHRCDCSRLAPAPAPAPTSPCLLLVGDYPIDWNDMETAAASPSSDMGEWYVDDCMQGCGMYFGHGDLDGYSSLFMHTDNSVDQFYNSLWE